MAPAAIKKDKMRRKDRIATPEHAKNILETAEYGVLSIASLEGEPYGIPLNFAWTENCIYFHCATTGRKIKILADNPRCSFSVVGKTQVVPEHFGTLYESVVVTGFVQELSGEEKYQGLVFLVSKYAPEYMDKSHVYIKKMFDKTKVFIFSRP